MNTPRNMANNTPRGGTSRTESELCKRAYDSLDPLTRYDPQKPKTPFYELERHWLDSNISNRFEIFSKNVLQKYLDVDDPFLLLSHNPDTKLTRTKLEQAKDCIWKKYYAPLERVYNQSIINKLRNKKENRAQDDFNKYFDVKRGYVDQMSLKLSFEKFIQKILESSNLDVTNNSISEECSSLMNPTDVFAPCTQNCIDMKRIGGKKNLAQPRLLQNELTKFDNTLKDMYKHLIDELERTKYELKKELEAGGVHHKRINDILDDKFGSIITVPDAREKSESKVKLDRAKAMNSSLSPGMQKVQNKRNKEAEKKRKQKLQNRLIKTVVNDKGRLISNYDNLFTLETPFNATSKGKRISKNTGVLKTKYDRSDKRIELQLRFKANQALTNTQNILKKRTEQGKTDTKDFKMLSDKAKLLKELVNKPHANKPLKLVRANGKKTTVARGGDKAMRKILSLFGIKEFKDQLDGMKQKYAFTEKTEKILNSSDIKVTGPNHPTVKNFKYFEFKDLENTIEKSFLKFLYNKMKNLKIDDMFDVGELKKYERIDIPYVTAYKLNYGGYSYTFVLERNLNDSVSPGKPQSKFISTFRLDKKSIASSTDSLTYKIDPSYGFRVGAGLDFVNYNEAVRLARRLVRSENRTSMLLKDDKLARFYLRNEDKYRMEPIGNILKVIDLHKPTKSSTNKSSKSPPTTQKITYRPSTPPPKSRSKSKQ